MKKSNVEKNVLKLLNENKTLAYSYSALCLSYWTRFNHVAYNCKTPVFLTSPESICRAYRNIIAKGVFCPSEAVVETRKNLSQAYRDYYRCVGVIV